MRRVGVRVGVGVGDGVKVSRVRVRIRVSFWWDFVLPGLNPIADLSCVNV